MTTRAEYITAKISRLESRLTLYVNAETAILNGAQSYSIGDRTLTRANLRNIQETIEKIENELISLGGGGKVRVQRVVPRDT